MISKGKNIPMKLNQCRRLFLYLYAIAPLESADVLFYARYLDAADIWKEKKPHCFGVCIHTVN